MPKGANKKTGGVIEGRQRKFGKKAPPQKSRKVPRDKQGIAVVIMSRDKETGTVRTIINTVMEK